MKRWDLRPHRLQLQADLPALCVLDAALDAARAALVAEHPDARRRRKPPDEPLPPIIVVAALLVERTVELQRLLDRYRRVLDDFLLSNGLSLPLVADRQQAFPF